MRPFPFLFSHLPAVTPCPHIATFEGESYLRLARTTGFLPPTRVPLRDDQRRRADSYQNVHFSLARFRKLTDAYLARITVVGHAFKRCRFEQLRRLTLL